MSQPPGHYPAEGDPPNTLRYWDGEQWVGDPIPAPPSATPPPQPGAATAPDQPFATLAVRLVVNQLPSNARGKTKSLGAPVIAPHASESPPLGAANDD